MTAIHRFATLSVLGALWGCQRDTAAPGDARYSTSPPLPAADPAITFVASAGLSVMNADGSNQAVVVASSKTTIIGPGLPSWSPNAQSIVFQASIGGVSGLWIVDVSVVNGTPVGTNLHKLQITCPLGGATAGADPDWSPNGDVIAFIGGCILPWDANIYVVPPAGGTATVVYTSPESFSPEWPTWSPDESRLVFEERGDTGSVVPRSLIIRDLATSTNTVVIPSTTTLFFRWPAWSHDGSQIAFSGYTGNNPETVYTIAATSGASPTQVMAGSDPTWSPDGSKLAFTGSITGRGKSTTGIVALTLATGATQLLASGGSHVDWRRF